MPNDHLRKPCGGIAGQRHLRRMGTRTGRSRDLSEQPACVQEPFAAGRFHPALSGRPGGDGHMDPVRHDARQNSGNAFYRLVAVVDVLHQHHVNPQLAAEGPPKIKQTRQQLVEHQFRMWAVDPAVQQLGSGVKAGKNGIRTVQFLPYLGPAQKRSVGDNSDGHRREAPHRPYHRAQSAVQGRLSRADESQPVERACLAGLQRQSYLFNHLGRGSVAASPTGQRSCPAQLAIHAVLIARLEWERVDPERTSQPARGNRPINVSHKSPPGPFADHRESCGSDAVHGPGIQPQAGVECHHRAPHRGNSGVRFPQRQEFRPGMSVLGSIERGEAGLSLNDSPAAFNDPSSDAESPAGRDMPPKTHSKLSG